jgi:cytochrome c biogenesis protein CcmG/thiol:disulfide interchange protein DsbE
MNWKRALLAALFAVPVIGLFMWGMSRDPRDIPSPLPGREAPTFKLAVFAPGQEPLARPAGDTVRLDSLKGQVVVLNFWASWCLACRDEHEVLSEVARTYAGKPVHFLGVLYNDDPASGTRWITEMGGQSYPSVVDPGARTAIDYGLYGVPETFFLDANGRVAYKHTGPVSAAVLHRVVDSLMTAATAVAPSAGSVEPVGAPAAPVGPVAKGAK